MQPYFTFCVGAAASGTVYDDMSLLSRVVIDMTHVPAVRVGVFVGKPMLIILLGVGVDSYEAFWPEGAWASKYKPPKPIRPLSAMYQERRLRFSYKLPPPRLIRTSILFNLYQAPYDRVFIYPDVLDAPKPSWLILVFTRFGIVSGIPRAPITPLSTYKTMTTCDKFRALSTIGHARPKDSIQKNTTTTT